MFEDERLYPLRRLQRINLVAPFEEGHGVALPHDDCEPVTATACRVNTHDEGAGRGCITATSAQDRGGIDEGVGFDAAPSVIRRCRILALEAQQANFLYLEAPEHDLSVTQVKRLGHIDFVRRVFVRWDGVEGEICWDSPDVALFLEPGDENGLVEAFLVLPLLEHLVELAGRAARG